MHFRQPPRSGPIRRSQFNVPAALDLRETLSAKLAAIAQRGEPVPLGDEEEEEDSASSSSSDEEDGASSSGSSAASSPESSPAPSPTTAAPTIAPTLFSSTLYTSLGPAPTSTFIPSLKEEKEEDSDSDSDDEFPDPTGTLGTGPTGAPATAEAVLSTGAAEASVTSGPNGARQSGDVLIMSGKPPPPPPSGISQTTEHVLIAAGSIGATLLIVIVVFGIYTMRRKGLTFRDLVQMSRRGRGRPDRTMDIAKPSINRSPSYASDYKERYVIPQPPPKSLTRFDSTSSRGLDGQRDYLGVSLGFRPDTPPKESNRSFLEETTPPRGTLSRSPSNSRSRSPTNYDTSPPILPIQRSDSYKSSQRYSSEQNDTVSPDAPGPIYQQFTASRRFTTNRNNPNYESHFSWTQSSQAPPTPLEPKTPTTTADGRISVATTASSVARFRTVDSWVGNQTGRIPSTQLRGQPPFSPYRASSSTNGGLGQVDEGHAGWQAEAAPDNNGGGVPSVPSVPSYYKQAPMSGPGHQRQLTGYSDATVFRQHPGEEVQIPRGSLVPSEVLDRHLVPSAL